MLNPNYKYKDGKIRVKVNGLWIEPSFERYENIEPIGKPGANGVVIKGTHKITRRDDAIKIWLPRKRNGKNGEIYIIDFGTSSISSYKEQSNHRENFLMYELVEKTLANQFDNKAFLYRKYSLRGDNEEVDEIRSVVPIFFSESVLCYLHLMIMLTNLHNIINQPKDIYEYCRYILQKVFT